MNDASTNLSKIKREHLLNICSKMKNGEIVDITEIAELEQFVKSIKYGLTFEKHEEPIDVKLRTHIPVFKEFKEVINNPDSSDCNFLLEGDNLHSLKLLERTHKGRIDVIYIDPPYNTLNDDFAYGDKFVDEKDGFIHSKWLSFMHERLLIARKLLSEDGVIFISIDDREQAQLKLLCDSIFGENNFINCLVIKMSELSGVKMSHIESKLPKLKEYCLIYAKNINRIKLNPIEKNKMDNLDEFKKYEKYYSKIIENKSLPVEDWQIISIKDYLEKYDIHCDNDDELLKFKMKNADRIVYRTNNSSFNNIKCNKKIASIISPTGIEYIWWEGKQMLFFSDYTKSYEGDLWTDISSINLNKEGGVHFQNGKKPLKLLKRLFSMINKKDAIILDFFAGSGSTGEAVMSLNTEDVGNRKFILCTNNEISASRQLDYIHSKGYMLDVKACGKNKTTKSKIDKFFDENPNIYQELIVDNYLEYETYGVCQSVTYQRLNTVITGIRPDGSKYSDGIKSNLQYFQTDMIDNEDEDLDEILYEASILLTELENMSTVDNKTIFIADDDEMVDEIITNASVDLKIVYVADDVLLDTKQTEFFDRHHIEVKRIPQYYYKEM